MLKTIRQWFKNWFAITPAQARKLWTKALRSGKYKQAKGKLKTPDGYCCLGVACEVYQRHVGDLIVTKALDAAGNTAYFCFDKDAASGTLLPTKVQNWLGGVSTHAHLTDAFPVPERGSNAHSLTILNDEFGFSFNQIADLIDSGKVKTSV